MSESHWSKVFRLISGIPGNACEVAGTFGLIAPRGVVHIAKYADPLVTKCNRQLSPENWHITYTTFDGYQTLDQMSQKTMIQFQDYIREMGFKLCPKCGKIKDHYTAWHLAFVAAAALEKKTIEREKKEAIKKEAAKAASRIMARQTLDPIVNTLKESGYDVRPASPRMDFIMLADGALVKIEFLDQDKAIYWVAACQLGDKS